MSPRPGRYVDLQAPVGVGPARRAELAARRRRRARRARWLLAVVVVAVVVLLVVLVAGRASAAPVESVPAVDCRYEDRPVPPCEPWDCETEGNRVCGPVAELPETGAGSVVLLVVVGFVAVVAGWVLLLGGVRR